MKIAHVALWCRDLERAVAFWEKYFGAVAGAPYASARRPGFVSRFVRLAEGAELELMSAPWLEEGAPPAVERPGWAHVAISMRWLPACLPTAYWSPPRAIPATVSTKPWRKIRKAIWSRSRPD